MQYIQPPWENYFFSKVHAAEKSLFISSPYIKYSVAGLLSTWTKLLPYFSTTYSLSF